MSNEMPPGPPRVPHSQLDDLLKEAVCTGNTEELKELITAGANLNTVWEGMNSLMLASNLGHVDVVKYLLGLRSHGDTRNPSKVDKNEVIYNRSYYSTAELQLHVKSASGRIDINHVPKKGGTALIYASQAGHAEIVALLLECGAKTTLRSDGGWTPTLLASQNGYHDVVLLLLLCGADVNDAHYTTGVTALLVAGWNGHVDVVRTLLTWGADVNRRSHDGQSALFVASSNRHTEVVQLLLEAGADVDSRTHDGRTALLQSSYSGHAEIVRLLLDAGANINSADRKGFNSLLTATQNAHWDVMTLLLKRGAHVNASAYDGTSSLILACERDCSDIVALLLHKGASVNLPTHNGLTPLIQASQFGHSDVVSLLLSRGAVVDLAAQNGRTALIQASQRGLLLIVNLLLQSGANVEATDFMGTTSLCIASGCGHTDTVRTLLEWGANVNTCDDKGITSLYEASQYGHSEIVRILLEHGAYVNAVRSGGWSSLHMASRKGHTTIVQLLLENKAEANIASDSGTRALSQASQLGRTEAVRLLLQHGADANLHGRAGATPLILASQQGHCDVVRSLLEAGADANVLAEDGRTALLQASQNGHTDVIEMLLKYNTKADITSCEGWGGLHSASRYGHREMVRLLLDKGADVNSYTNTGATALILASYSGYCDAVRLLLDRGADVNLGDMNGFTPLMVANMQGHDKIVKILLQNGAKVNMTLIGMDHSTALILASQNGHAATVALLLQFGAAVDAVDQDGASSLHVASFHGHIRVVKLLISNKADVNLHGPSGSPPVLSASQSGNLDIVRLLVEHGAVVDQAESSGKTALIQAAQHGHSNVISFLIQTGASVNLASQSGRTALIQASQNGHIDAVKVLLRCGADVSIADELLTTAVVAAAASGHWKTVDLLLASGGDPHHSNMNRETGAMYIAFGETSGMCDNTWGKYVKYFPAENPPMEKSHYGMSALSLILVAALQHNRSIPDHFIDIFSSVLSETSLTAVSWLYGFLPELLHSYARDDDCLFQPYQGVEGRISLHSLQTAMLCKLPTKILLLSFATESPTNMLGQTPLHLIAMENRHLSDMDEKMHYMVHTMDLRFSQPDANGRMPYHIACMCLNAQFLQCALRSDPYVGQNIQKQDNIGITPLEYMLHGIQTTTDANNVPMLRKLSTQRYLQLLSSALNVTVLPRTHSDSDASPGIEQTTKELFHPNLQLAQLTNLEDKCRKVVLSTGDLAEILRHKGKGIVNLYEKSNEWLIVMILRLLQKIGDEVAKLDPMFAFVPSLKGSIQEATKCGWLDEMDVSIAFVNFTKYFDIDLKHVDLGLAGHTLVAAITPVKDEVRYWDYSEGLQRFSSMQFCADFWEVFLDAMQKVAVQESMKEMRISVENCKRKNGFVGMLKLSYKTADCIQVISVDLAPCVDHDKLEGYIALLRPRHSEARMVGEEFHRGLELSSSKNDWGMFRCLPYEVLCGYTLVKVLRSLTGTFQTASGAIYDSDVILPSYMLKAGLLWVLDPDDKFGENYPGMHKPGIFTKENRSSYASDVKEMCQRLMQEVKDTNIIMETKEIEDLARLDYKCQSSSENLSVEERVLPYLLVHKYHSGITENGIDLTRMTQRIGLHEMNHKKVLQDNCSSSSSGIDIPMQEDPKKFSETAEVHIDPLPDCSHPPLTANTLRKARLWALRILRMLTDLLQFGQRTQSVGIRNYYLPGQEIYVRDRDLTIGICQALESLLQLPDDI